MGKQKSNHIIHKQNVEISLPDPQYHYSVSNDISDVLRFKITPILDDVLSQLSTPNELIIINKLDFELGNIPLNEFKKEFTERLTEKIKKELTLQIKVVQQKYKNGLIGNTSDDIYIVPVLQSKLDIIVHFLEWGWLPPHSNLEGKNIVEIFQEVLSNKKQLLKNTLPKLLQTPKTIERLVYQFPKSIIDEIYQLLVPNQAQYLIEIEQEILKSKNLDIRQISKLILNRIFVERKIDIKKDDIFYKEKIRDRLVQIEQHNSKNKEEIDMNVDEKEHKQQHELEMLEEHRENISEEVEQTRVNEDEKETTQEEEVEMLEEHRENISEEVEQTRVNENEKETKQEEEVEMLEEHRENISEEVEQTRVNENEKETTQEEEVEMTEDREENVSKEVEQTRVNKDGKETKQEEEVEMLEDREEKVSNEIEQEITTYNKNEFGGIKTNRRQETKDDMFKSNLNLFQFILLNNQRPWWGSSNSETLEELFFNLKNSNAALLQKSLKTVLKKDKVTLFVPQIIQDFSEAGKIQLLSLLYPDFAGFMITQKLAIEQFFSKEKMLWKANKNYDLSAWSLVLEETFKLQTNTFNLNVFLKNIIQKVSEKTNQNKDIVQEKLHKISLEEESRGERRFTPLKMALMNDLENIKEEENQNIKGIPSVQKITKVDSIKLIEYYLRTGSFELPNFELTVEAFNKILETAIQKKATYIRNILLALSPQQLIDQKILMSINKLNFDKILKQVLYKEDKELLQYIEIISPVVSGLIEKHFLEIHAINFYHRNKPNKNKLYSYLKDFLRFTVRMKKIDSKAFVVKLRNKIKGKTLKEKEINQVLTILEREIKPSKIRPQLNSETKKETNNALYKKLEASEIYIKNAGAVLLWPFLSHYFIKLEMLTEDKQFKSKEMAHRAVHLIEYLVTKRQATPEHELVLNKILCGIPIDEPIEMEIEMTALELEIGESLLKAVINQWSALKGTSIDGLRGGFLYREGKLTQEGGGWKLRVEQKPFDMLLRKIPWGLGMIKISWMPKILRVDWT